MGWLGGWNRRKSHVIQQQAGAGTNYQVAIKVYKGAGVDGTETYHHTLMGKVYCGGNCRDDFGDIRFTASDGSTELDYWMHDDVSSGVYAVFWVEISGDLTAGDVTIYVYYKNDSATTTENMANTFQHCCDDEETAVDALPAGWVDASTGSCGGLTDLCVKDDQFRYGTRSFKAYDSCSDGYTWGLINNPTFTEYVVVDLWIRKHIVGDAWYGSLMFDDGTEYAIFYWHHGAAVLKYLDGSSQYWTLTDTFNNDTWYHIQLYLKFSATRLMMKCIVDGVTCTPQNKTMRATAGARIRYGGFRQANVGSYSHMDCFFIRKWTGGNEPAHGAWGSEEQSSLISTSTNSIMKVLDII